MRKLDSLRAVFVFGAIVLLGHPDTVAAQTLTVSPNPLAFNLDGPQLSGQSITKSVAVTSSDPLPRLAVLITTSNLINWLGAAVGANTTVDVTVSNTATMGPGTYTGKVYIFEDNTNTQVILNVTLTIANSSTGLTAAPSTVTFLQQSPGAGLSQTVFLNYNGGLVPATSSSFTPTTGGIAFVDLTPNQNGSVTLTVNALATAVGSYAGNLRMTSNFGTLDVPVSLTIGAGSGLAASPNPVEFTIQFGGTAPSQNVSITSNGQPVTVTSATATQSTAQPWLIPTVPSGGNSIVNLAVNGTGLSNGIYNATVQAVTNKGAITFQVKLTVGVVATLQVNPTALSFAFQVGTSFPADQTISATSNGSAFSFVANATSSPVGWLSVSPPGQQVATPSTLSVRVNPQGLAAGTYQGNIRLDTFGGSENSSVDVPVSLVVSNLPILISSPTALSFNSQVGVNPALQNLSITSSSTLLTYTTGTSVLSPVGGSWLKVNSPSGFTNSGVLGVEVNTQGLPVGVYKGVVTISSASSGNGSIAIPVTLTVTAGATFQVTPSSLSFAYQRGQQAPANRAVNVALTSGSLGFTASAATNTGQGWLQVSPTIGTAPTNIVVSVNVTGGGGASVLTPGTYTGTVSITPAGSSVIQTIPVTLIVSDTALLTINPLELTFESSQGSGEILPTQSVAVSSTDGSTITYTVTPSTSSAGQNWLSVNQPTGPTNSSVTISAAPGNLAAGTYKGTVAVTATVPANVANSPQNIGVTLNVKATALLTVAPTSLSFTQSGSGGVPESRALTVTGAGGIISFTAVATTNVGSWLSVNPSSATTPGNLTVTANGAGLAAGSYAGTIFISSPGAANTQTVNVTMTVTSSAAPVIVVNPTTLLPVTYQVGGSNPLPQTISVSIQGGGNQTFNASAVVASGTGWLSVSPTTGTTPGSVTVTVTPASLAVGSYSGTVSIAVAGAVTLNLPISLTVSPAAAPTPTVVAVQHGASFLFTSLAPGMNIVIRGSDMGPSTLTTYHIGSNGLFDTTLAETRVLFDGVAAPIYYTSSAQVSVFVPYSVAGKTSTQLVVQYKGVSSLPQTYRVVASAPGIFTLNATSTGSGDGSGQGAILNQNFGINSSTNPETAGNFISIYATGEGQTSPGGVDGAITPLRPPFPAPLLQVTVSIGGIPVPPSDVTYAGNAPGAIAGLLQVNARIPAGLPSGPQAVFISVGGASSQSGVIVNVRARQQ